MRLRGKEPSYILEEDLEHIFYCMVNLTWRLTKLPHWRPRLEQIRITSYLNECLRMFVLRVPKLQDHEKQFTTFMGVPLVVWDLDEKWDKEMTGGLKDVRFCFDNNVVLHYVYVSEKHGYGRAPGFYSLSGDTSLVYSEI